MSGSLAQVGQEVRVNDGRIYQITTPRQSFYNNYYTDEGNWYVDDLLFLNLTPFQYYFSDIVFGTRQKHSSRLWKVVPNEENVEGPVIQPLYGKTDERSTVSCIDVHPSDSSGEYCELRPGKLTVYRKG